MLVRDAFYSAGEAGGKALEALGIDHQKSDDYKAAYIGIEKEYENVPHTLWRETDGDKHCILTIEN